MSRLRRLTVLICGLFALCGAPAGAKPLAPTPPMGWNSWDAYGLTITEADFKANVSILAGLKDYGWRYAVIDEGWYMQNPFGDKLETRQYRLDQHGLLDPVVARFPSAAGGAGFKPLADWVHAQGLKFGIHIVRGIPKQAVRDNLSIGGSAFHAADAADTADLCPWDDGNFGVRDNPAGQAYYDSMIKRYADWGLDFIKVDCIADHPYKVSEIRQIALAIQHSGRPIVLSLSPGPTQLSHAAEVAQYAQMWRIANDTWDSWRFAHPDPKDDFPNGVINAFDNLALWAPYVKPGQWPDADMLPFGSLTPHPGWGDPRQSRLTPDEERTQFILWAIARSPLILGGSLTKLDDLTKSLIENKDLIAVDQHAYDSHPVANLPVGFDDVRVWVASEGENASAHVLAVFNLRDQPVILHAPWTQLGLTGGHSVRNLIDGSSSSTETLDVTLPAHGSAIFKLM